jgi:hypothetical protein
LKFRFQILHSFSILYGGLGVKSSTKSPSALSC